MSRYSAHELAIACAWRILLELIAREASRVLRDRHGIATGCDEALDSHAMEFFEAFRGSEIITDQMARIHGATASLGYLEAAWRVSPPFWSEEHALDHADRALGCLVRWLGERGWFIDPGDRPGPGWVVMRPIEFGAESVGEPSETALEAALAGFDAAIAEGDGNA